MGYNGHMVLKSKILIHVNTIYGGRHDEDKRSHSFGSH